MSYLTQGPDRVEIRKVCDVLRVHLRVFTDWWFARDSKLRRLRALTVLLHALPSDPLGPEPTQRDVDDRLRTVSSVLLRLSPKVLPIPKDTNPAPYVNARDAFFETIKRLAEDLGLGGQEALEVLREARDTPSALRKFVLETRPTFEASLPKN